MKIGILAVCILFFCSALYAEGSAGFEFTRDYIKSLSCVKEGISRIETTDFSKYDDEAAMAMALVKSLRLANADMAAAKALVLKYKDSPNETISSAAKHIIFVYDMQVEINNKGMAMFEKVYGPQGTRDPATSDLDVMTSEIASLGEDRISSLGMLLNCSAMIMYMLAEHASDSPDKAGNLAITRPERNELLKEINAAFGSSTKGGMRYIDACGAAFKRFLLKYE
jgi:hypothetical protein